jgi:hypothetical protein
MKVRWIECAATVAVVTVPDEVAPVFGPVQQRWIFTAVCASVVVSVAAAFA